ncbi:hypothetical protein B296_00052890 [Ensete ventricosum]|uniref:gibberellin 2beta-dioxygenase n=1 Tax=Ensete ventricosum TaxID=4639 RepID=A0A426Y157_ENSVE|nr:hypothetical protein B296_00052890 [Ensete ventricosum]
MVVLANPGLDEIPLVRPQKHGAFFSAIPVVDLSKPCSAEALVKACEDVGFFKVINHNVPMDVVQRLEAEAVKFFEMPQVFKEKSGPADPFGYGNKRIGPNGDVGLVEYLLFGITSKPLSYTSMSFLEEPSACFPALSEYLLAVKKLASDVLELIAEGLKIEPRDVLTGLVTDEQSDGLFRLNHYPRCPLLERLNRSWTGFGEHTDPQIISVLRSNNTTGLQISLKNGSWVSVPPDQESFFIVVGDCLQVRIYHPVASAGNSIHMVSMIYFFGPPPAEKIAPLPQLMGEGEQSKYKEFTWGEYKKAAYKSRLGDNRLGQFEK